MSEQNEDDYRFLMSSWERVRENEMDFVSFFYEELFTVNPQYREMFSEDLTNQKLKFLEMTNVIVNSAKYLDELKPVMKSMGKRHEEYGALPEDYDNLIEAFISAFRQVCNTVSEEEVQAWRSILFIIKEIMTSSD